VADNALLKDPTSLKKLQKLKARLAKERTWTLADRHDFGEGVREVRDGEVGHGGEGHDRRATACIAKELGRKPDFLNKHVRFAAWLTREQAAKLDERWMRAGSPVSWSLVRALLTVDDPERRCELLEQAIAGGWTSARLGKEIQRERGKKASGGGRTPDRPDDLNDLIDKMGQAAGGFVTPSQETWSGDTSLKKMTAALKTEQITPDLVARLQELQKKLAAARKEARKREAEVGRVLEGFQGKLTRRGKK
jgi:hypothetical protein